MLTNPWAELQTSSPQVQVIEIELHKESKTLRHFGFNGYRGILYININEQEKVMKRTGRDRDMRHWQNSM